MFFVGLDLAWAEKSRTGIAVVDSHGQLQHITAVIKTEDIVAVLEPFVAGECVVGIDAPLLVTNDSGPRPAEALLNRDFQRFHAGARPAYKAYPLGLFDPPRGAVLVEKLGLDIDPESHAARRAIEVYPHPATVALFGLGCTLKYKRGLGATPAARFRCRKSEMLRLIQQIETTLAAAPLPIRVNTHDGWATLRRGVRDAYRPFQLGLAEDQIDAVLCAYVAMMFSCRREEIRVYGDFPANGYIATPALRPGSRPLAY